MPDFQPKTPNIDIFELIELSPRPYSKENLEEKIEAQLEVWSEWKDSPDPLVKIKGEFLLSKSGDGEMVSLLQNTSYQQKVQNERAGKQKTTLDHLDRLLGALAVKGEIFEDEIEEISKKSRHLFKRKIERTEILSRVPFPVLNRPIDSQTEDNANKNETGSRITGGQDLLELLGYNDIYEFIGRSGSDSSHDLFTEAKEVQKLIEREEDNADNPLSKGLLESIEFVLAVLDPTTGFRDEYDQFNLLRAEKTLERCLAIGAIGGTITAAYVDSLLKFPSIKFIDSKRASFLIREFARKKKVLIEIQEGAFDKLEDHRCGNCGRIQEAEQTNCFACNHPLRRTCPNCSAPCSGNQKFCACGQNLKHQATGHGLLGWAKYAASKGFNSEAFHLIERAALLVPLSKEEMEWNEDESNRQKIVLGLEVELKSALRDRRLIAASELFPKLRWHDPQNSLLESEEKCQETLKNVANFSQQLKQAPDNLTRHQKCLDLFKIVTDDPWGQQQIVLEIEELLFQGELRIARELIKELATLVQREDFPSPFTKVKARNEELQKLNNSLDDLIQGHMFNAAAQTLSKLRKLDKGFDTDKIYEQPINVALEEAKNSRKRAESLQDVKSKRQALIRILSKVKDDLEAEKLLQEISLPSPLPGDLAVKRDFIRLEWILGEQIDGIQYKILRAFERDSSEWKELGKTSDSYFEDSSPIPGISYKYAVVAIHSIGADSSPCHLGSVVFPEVLPEILHFRANQPYSMLGVNIALTWDTRNATKVELFRNGKRVTTCPVKGKIAQTPSESKLVFVLRATGRDGHVESKIELPTQKLPQLPDFNFDALRLDQQFIHSMDDILSPTLEWPRLSKDDHRSISSFEMATHIQAAMKKLEKHTWEPVGKLSFSRLLSKILRKSLKKVNL